MKNKKGFSLVELSIVLIIIGLLVAIISESFSMMEEAKIRNDLAKIRNFDTAITNFIAKYKYKPGDITNAYTLFAGGDDTLCGTNTSSLAGYGCNGDGDGGNEFFATDGGELYRAWAHLYLAKLTNVKTDGKSAADKVPTASYNASIIMGGIENTKFGVSNDKFVIGGFATMWANSMPVIYAYNIDKKIDDGIPNRGKVMAHSTTNPTNCSDDPATKTTDDVVNYDLDYEERGACTVTIDWSVQQ